MSGPLSTYRVPSRPVFHDLEIVNPDYVEGGDLPEQIKIQVPDPHPTKMKLSCIPVEWDDEGQPTRWHSVEIARQRHVLDHRLNTEAPSKHAKGRAGKLTSEQRRRRQRDARFALAARQRAQIELHQRALDALAIAEAMDA